MFRQPLFDPKIEPSCSYCAHGAPTQDGDSILCPRHGVMLPSASCRRFVYDPLARVPSRQPKLPQFDADDFSL